MTSRERFLLFNKIHEEMSPLHTESSLMGPEATTHGGCLRLSHLTGPVNGAKPGTSRGAEPGLPGPKPWMCDDIGASIAAAGTSQHRGGLKPWGFVLCGSGGWKPKPVLPAGVGGRDGPSGSPGAPQPLPAAARVLWRLLHPPRGSAASAPASSSHRLPSVVMAVVAAPSAVFLQGPSGWMLEGRLPISTSETHHACRSPFCHFG